MSHIDVHEINLNLRYPNSRQEDITDAFMRGYQGAVKIGNDAVRRVKAEKAALERRIDELCAEVERGKAEFKKMDVWHSQELKAAMDENAKLRELVKSIYINYAADGVAPLGMICEYASRMKELGVEL